MKLRHVAVVAFSVIMACTIVVSMPGSVAHAFFTGKDFSKYLSKGDYTHLSITETAFKDLSEEFFSISEPTKSMVAAMNQIVDANAFVDTDQKHSALHFDGENFVDGQNHILEWRGGVINSLKAGNAVQARNYLGGALHTVQDFYAHSNWIELGHTEPNPDLGRPGHTLGPVAGPKERTCGIHNRGELVTKKLTSGYYSGEDRAALIPEIKCRHGGPGDFSPPGVGSGGINKDVTNKFFSPHGDSHKAAGAMAVKATEQFIRDITANLTRQELQSLFGSSLPPIICNTYSDTSTIDGSPRLDTLKLSIKTPLCLGGNQVWVPANKTVSCTYILVKKGDLISGTADSVTCEPYGQGYYDKVPEIEPFYEIAEQTPFGTITYQSWFKVDGTSGKVTERNHQLVCDPPNLSPKCLSV